MKISSLSFFADKRINQNTKAVSEQKAFYENQKMNFLSNYCDTVSFSAKIPKKISIIVPKGSPENLSSELEKGLISSDHMDRGMTAMRIGKLNIKENAGALKKLFTDGSAYVRFMAVQAFAKIGNPNNGHWLKVLINDKDPEVRKEVAIAIREFGNKKQIGITLELMKDKDLSVKSAAIRTLGFIGGKEHAKHLVPIPDFPVKVSSPVHPYEAYAESLGKIGSDEHVSELEKLLYFNNRRIQETAAASIAKIASLDTLLSFLPKLSDEKPVVRDIFAYLFGETKRMDFLSYLDNIKVTDGDEYVRRSASAGAEKILQANSN